VQKAQGDKNFTSEFYSENLKEIFRQMDVK
jgi:hypothetical protein